MRGVLLLIGEYILKMNHPDHFEFSFSVVTSTPHLSIITILYVVFKPNESTFEKVHFTSRLIRLSMWLSWQSNCFWHQRPLVNLFCKEKYHCMLVRMFYRIGFNQTSFASFYVAMQLNTKQSNSMSAIQWCSLFRSKWVISVL